MARLGTLIPLTLITCLFLCLRSTAVSEQPLFRAGLTPTPVKEKIKEKEIYSFSRFEAQFSAVCSEMEGDGRREKFYSIAEQASQKEKDCVSCRALWRSLLAACVKRTKNSLSNSKEIATPATVEGESEGGSGEVPDNSSQPDTGERLPARTPASERYPSTLLLDLISQLSIEAFELDQGDGGVSEAFRYLASVVRGAHGLSNLERDYYDTVLVYLLAAWEGRVDNSSGPAPTPGREINDFFDK